MTFRTYALLFVTQFPIEYRALGVTSALSALPGDFPLPTSRNPPLLFGPFASISRYPMGPPAASPSYPPFLYITAGNPKYALCLPIQAECLWRPLLDALRRILESELSMENTVAGDAPHLDTLCQSCFSPTAHIS